MSKSLSASCLVAAALLFSCVSSPPAQPERQAESPAAGKSAARERAQSLITGESGEAAGTAGGSAPAAAASPEASPAEAPSAPAELSAKEKQFIENYFKRLKYMVVAKEGAAMDDFQARSVITKANEYLLRQGFDVVNYDQLMKNMDDQRTAYEAEAGESMSLVQYIAQKLGADVYVELDAVSRAWSEGGKHYGEANFTASMFDPSTAELLGAVSYRTDRSLSTSSSQDALLNALVAGTAQFMPRIVRDSTTVLKNRYANGVRYQLVLQKTPDSRAVSAFRRNLRSRVREIVMGPSAADQTTMDIYVFGSISDLEDACYTAFEKTAGMENAYWVYTRGKTLTFNTGI